MTAPVELEYVPAMQDVHAEDPGESHPAAPRRIRAAVSARLAYYLISSKAAPSAVLAWRLDIVYTRLVT
jgi:hypothetical protein